jgi:hypothetical protein
VETQQDHALYKFLFAIGRLHAVLQAGFVSDLLQTMLTVHTLSVLQMTFWQNLNIVIIYILMRFMFEY